MTGTLWSGGAEDSQHKWSPTPHILGPPLQINPSEAFLIGKASVASCTHLGQT